MRSTVTSSIAIALLSLAIAACSREQASATQSASEPSQTASTSPAPAPALDTLTPEKAAALVKDVYTYAYPLVLMDVTQRQATNVPNATAASMRAPINQFAHFRSYPKADAKDVVRFNFDTLYSFAWLDLSQGPVILTVPDTNGRYYLVPTLDMWSDVFSSLGARTTARKPDTSLTFRPAGPARCRRVSRESMRRCRRSG